MRDKSNMKKQPPIRYYLLTGWLMLLLFLCTNAIHGNGIINDLFERTATPTVTPTPIRTLNAKTYNPTFTHTPTQVPLAKIFIHRNQPSPSQTQTPSPNSKSINVENETHLTSIQKASQSAKSQSLLNNLNRQLPPFDIPITTDRALYNYHQSNSGLSLSNNSKQFAQLDWNDNSLKSHNAFQNTYYYSSNPTPEPTKSVAKDPTLNTNNKKKGNAPILPVYHPPRQIHSDPVRIPEFQQRVSSNTWNSNRRLSGNTIHSMPNPAYKTLFVNHVDWNDESLITHDAFNSNYYYHKNHPDYVFKVFPYYDPTSTALPNHSMIAFQPIATVTVTVTPTPTPISSNFKTNRRSSTTASPTVKLSPRSIQSSTDTLVSMNQPNGMISNSHSSQWSHFHIDEGILLIFLFVLLITFSLIIILWILWRTVPSF